MQEVEKMKELFCSKCGHLKEHHRVSEQGVAYCVCYSYQPGNKPHIFDGAKFCNACTCNEAFNENY